ncbi:MAG: tripartite tricarboxylate transporter TctB family protein [Alphaproteobacteria bacterium]
MSHAALLLVFGGFAGYYLWETVGLSPQPENLVLVGPAAALCLFLVALQLGLVMRRRFPTASANSYEGTETVGAETDLEPSGSIKRAVFQMALLAVYPFLLPFLGFDGATAVFIFASLVLHGERRILRSVLLSLGFGFVFATLLDIAVPIEVPLIWHKLVP